MSIQTPKPAQGTWTLTAPDGRTWQADHPLKCCAMEQRERVPPDVALARIKAAAHRPTDEELLRTALEALEHHREQTRPIERTAVAIEALRNRLAQ